MDDKTLRISPAAIAHPYFLELFLNKTPFSRSEFTIFINKDRTFFFKYFDWNISLRSVVELVQQQYFHLFALAYQEIKDKNIFLFFKKRCFYFNNNAKQYASM